MLGILKMLPERTGLNVLTVALNWWTQTRRCALPVFRRNGMYIAQIVITKVIGINHESCHKRNCYCL